MDDLMETCHITLTPFRLSFKTLYIKTLSRHFLLIYFVVKHIKWYNQQNGTIYQYFFSKTKKDKSFSH